MSYIFDALQRSDVDRSGERNAVPAATELLERAESQAKSLWRAETSDDALALLRGPAPDSIPQLRVGLAEEPGINSPETAKFSPESDRAEAFGSFQCLTISPPARGRLVWLLERESPTAEAFRLLRVRMRHMRKDRPLKTVLITSTIPQEGKSFAAANLACALASGSQTRTLLVEADVRRPTLSRLFGLEKTHGLCEYMHGRRKLTESIYRLDGAGIWLLPAGSDSGDPFEEIQSSKLSQLFQLLTEWFDWIIVDTPPVLPMADTSAWSRLADGILLVTRRGVTEKRKLERGLKAIETGKLIGALLNCSDGASNKDYYYYRHVAGSPDRVNITA